MSDLSTEKLILSSLCLDEQYSREILVHLKDEYFNGAYLKLFKLIEKHTKKYDTLPNKTFLLHDIGEIKNDDEKNHLKEIVNDLFTLDRPDSRIWLIEQTEIFCQEKAIYNAMVNSLEILEGNNTNLKKEIVPELLSEAIAVTFDNSVGMDYYDDAEKRYLLYTEKHNKVPFEYDIFNKITNGGVTTKTLNIVAAPINCFTGDEEIEVYYITNMTFKLKDAIKEGYISSKKMKLIDIFNDFHYLKNRISVKNQYGQLTPILDVVSKFSDCLEITFENNIKRKVSTTHRFMDIYGNEVFAKDATIIKTKTGTLKIIDKKSIEPQQVYDISIDAPHWYLDQYDIIHHNCGKTLTMIDLACGYLKQGYNVLYITLEMAESEIMKRIDANMLDISMNLIDQLDKAQFLTKVQRLKAKNYGQLKVKEYPTDEGHCGHFKTLLQELKLKQKFIPEIIIVDYLGICASSRVKKSQTNSYEFYKNVSGELRALAQNNDIILWSCVQLQRSVQNANDAGFDNVAESIAIVSNCDTLFLITRTEELDELGQIKFKQLKNRFGDKTKNTNFIMGIDLEKQSLFEIITNEKLNNDSDLKRYSDEEKNAIKATYKKENPDIVLKASQNSLKRKFTNLDN